MRPTGRLTFEDECSLSDAIYAGREPRAKRENGQRLTAREERILAAADDAVEVLVVSHEPLIKRLARQVLLGGGASASVDFVDLCQVGRVAMITCARAYDARRRDDGIDRDTGNRFSFYSQQRVRRDMWRAAIGGRGLPSGAREAAETSREWVFAFQRLKDELRRRPTDDEVFEVTGIKREDVDVALVASVLSLDAPVTHSADTGTRLIDISAHRPVDEGAAVDAAMTQIHYIDALGALLRQVLPGDEAEAFLLWLGADRGFPRALTEVARDMDVSPVHAGTLTRSATARLRHPQNAERVAELAGQALREVEGDTARGAA